MKIFTIPMSEDQESDVIDGQLYNLPWGFTVGENDYINTQFQERGLKREDYTHSFDTRNYNHVFTLKES